MLFADARRIAGFIAVQGMRSVLHLAEPLPVGLAVGDEIGRRSSVTLRRR
ncbi:hypothetical protein [Parafrankia sp. EAN1pec]